MAELDNTNFIGRVIDLQNDRSAALTAAEVLERVYEALKEKGYNPVSQIVGYIISGDPTYITNHNGARALIMKVERDELLAELVEHYVKTVL